MIGAVNAAAVSPHLDLGGIPAEYADNLFMIVGWEVQVLTHRSRHL